MATMLIRRALKRIKAKGYKQSLAELNMDADGDEDCKFVAVAHCELAVFVTTGIVLKRPALLSTLREWVSQQMGRNKRLFVALENPENKGEYIFLLFKPQDLDDILLSTDADLLQGGNLDTGFSTDRGVSILTSNNTVVKKGSHEGLYFGNLRATTSPHDEQHVYVFQPHSKARALRTASFEIKFIDGNDSDDAQSKANMEATEAWIETTILPLEHNSSEQENLQAEH
jgi:hypothetical protein